MSNLIGPEQLLAKLAAEGITLKRPTLTKYAAMGVIPPSRPADNRRGWGWPPEQVDQIIELIKRAQRAPEEGVRLGTLACQQWARQSPQEAVTTAVNSLGREAFTASCGPVLTGQTPEGWRWEVVVHPPGEEENSR